MNGSRRILICIFLILWSVAAIGAPKVQKKKKRKPAQDAAANEIAREAAVLQKKVNSDLENSLEQAASFNLPNTTMISLKDTINLAIKNNPNIRTANLTCESASNSFWATHYNYYLPSLNLSAENQHVMFKDNLLIADSNTVNDTAAVSLTGTVPWLGLNYTLTPAAATRTRAPNVGEQYQSQSSISLELPLLKDFGPVVRSIVIEQATLDLAAAKLGCNSVVLKTVNDIRISFWDLLFANRALNIQQETLRAAADLVNETKTKIKNGLLPEMEISNSLANYYSRQAELLRVEQEVIGSQQRFKQLLGVST
ncbi:MAG: TolC family protein, partial [Bdellovibrionia bacterium]